MKTFSIELTEEQLRLARMLLRSNRARTLALQAGYGGEAMDGAAAVFGAALSGEARGPQQELAAKVVPMPKAAGVTYGEIIAGAIRAERERRAR